MQFREYHLESEFASEMSNQGESSDQVLEKRAGLVLKTWSRLPRCGLEG